MLKSGCILTLVLIYSTTFCYGELFTAVVELEQLLDIETALIDNLDNYVEQQQIKIETLRNLLHDYRRLHAEAADDVQTYLANPINAYRLTKRLTADWNTVENLVNFNPADEFTSNVTQQRIYLKFPTLDDLNGAAQALVRLQVTYNLDTASIAKGELNGVRYTAELTSHDCFEIGRQLYNSGDFRYTKLWMEEALTRLEKESHDSSVIIPQAASPSDILEYLAFATYKIGDIVKALELTNDLLELVPDHERAVGNKVYYEKKLKEMKGDTNDPKANAAEKDEPVYPSESLMTERKVNALCRDEVRRDPSVLAKLRCRYISKNHPFLEIAPLKLEEMSLDPYIVVYHEVLSDSEIEHVKAMARPRFKRATVQNSDTGEQQVAQYRISKSSWLKDKESKVVATITRRVEDMTDLSMETAEELQVVNYGIGGHYAAHFDFARKDEAFQFEVEGGIRNRIATVLFYMSDVEQGGATVFPKVDLALFPKKGSAAFWYNLYASGEGNYGTRHAACPVLAGSKWVCNKWIHEAGQEFRRPCLKNREDEKHKFNT